jgi:hypothetical protein
MFDESNQPFEAGNFDRKQKGPAIIASPSFS